MSDHDDAICYAEMGILPPERPDPEDEANLDSVEQHYDSEIDAAELPSAAWDDSVVHYPLVDVDACRDVLRRCNNYLVHPGVHTPGEVLVVSLIRDLARALAQEG